MRVRSSLLLASLLGLLVGCGHAEGTCAIDTDCPLGQRCGADNTCVDRGVRPEPEDPIDAGARDASTADSGTDAGTDAGEEDSGTDAGEVTPVRCETFGGEFRLQEAIGACDVDDGLRPGLSLLGYKPAEPGRASCYFSLDGNPLSGRIAVDADGSFSGLISLHGVERNCSAMLAADSVVVMCPAEGEFGACTLAFER